MCIGVANESGERLRYKQIGEWIEAAVEIADGDEECPALATHVCEIYLVCIGVQSVCAVKAQTHHLLGKDAHDARVHLFCRDGGGVAPPQRERIACGVGGLQVVEEPSRGAVLEMLAKVDHRRKRLLLNGQLLAYIGDEAR